MQWRKFGDITFQMMSVPGVLGGRLCGTIRIPTVALLKKEMLVTLVCVQRLSSGTGKNRTTITTTLWKTEKKISPKEFLQQGRSTAIPVEFYIPCNQPVSKSNNPDKSITWSIHAKAAMPGIDFSASFEVPVFKTPESDAAINTAVLDQGRVVTAVDESDHETSCYEPMDETETGDALRHAGLKLKPTPSGGIAIISPILRQPMRALSLLFSLLIGVGVFMAIQSVDVPLFFSIVLGVILLVILLLSLDVLVGIHRVIVDKDGIQAQGGPFGRGTSHHLSFNALADIIKRSNSQVNQTKLYTVILRKRDGKRIKAFKGLERREAQAVIDALNTAIADYKE